MNDTLKVAGRIGAELGAAKAENERLRGLLRECAGQIDLLIEVYVEDDVEPEDIAISEQIKADIHAALSRQAEPTDTFTAVDMATAAAQGFRDGQAAVEQAPAEDEHQPVGWHTDDHLTDKSATTYDREVADRWRGKGWPVYELYARPAQAEQQPAYVECRECTDCGHVGINDAHQTDATCAMCDWSGPSPVEDQCPDCGKENAMGAACPKCSGRYRILAETHVAAPIAQTEQQPEQSGLVEAAKGALGAIQDALEDAYHNAYPECCGQAHLECCGSPLQAWSEADQKTMERFAPHEKALRAALSAQRGDA